MIKCDTLWEQIQNEEGNLECLATDNVFNENEVVEKKELVPKRITSRYITVIFTAQKKEEILKGKL